VSLYTYKNENLRLAKNPFAVGNYVIKSSHDDPNLAVVVEVDEEDVSVVYEGPRGDEVFPNRHVFRVLYAIGNLLDIGEGRGKDMGAQFAGFGVGINRIPTVAGCPRERSERGSPESRPKAEIPAVFPQVFARSRLRADGPQPNDVAAKPPRPSRRPPEASSEARSASDGLRKSLRDFRTAEERRRRKRCRFTVTLILDTILRWVW